MDRMLINAAQPEELRVALTRDNFLYDLDIERSGVQKTKANIYKGKITRIEPSLAAAFVDYGAQKQGFLPFKEVSSQYHRNAKKNQDEKISIADVLKPGQELMVQVEKVERGNKGAALTTFITLAGCYLVMMPNNPRAGGISRRIEGDDRDGLKQAIAALNVPESMGVIVRTAGVGKEADDLKWDFEVLYKQWQAIEKVYGERSGPFLIHQEGDVVIRSIRDNLRKDVHEIIVDHPEIYAKAKNYIEQVRPDFISRIKLYQNPIPLFTHYQIERQIETAYQREVILKSGGSIVIDKTEALVSIDINSAKATGGSDIEETALNTNIEAAEEIARQLRLRDIGGLIVIDFIDMAPIKNQRTVENKLKEALAADRARIQVRRISRFGLLEMSRQRLRPSLSEHSQVVCSRCDGRGSVRSIESLASSMIRIIEESAITDDRTRVEAQLPIEVATFILNEKRHIIHDIEKRAEVMIYIIPNKFMETPDYKIQCFNSDDKGRQSYKIPQTQRPQVDHKPHPVPTRHTEPAISNSLALQRPRNRKPSLIKRLWSEMFKKSPVEQPSEHKPSKPRAQRQRSRPRRRSSNKKQAS